jgi:hypothetical protein
MSYICEVCNGMAPLTGICPECNHPLEDQGKLSDFYGPYSPYRPADDLKITNGYLDVKQHRCIHLANCPDCSHSYLVFVRERH